MVPHQSLALKQRLGIFVVDNSPIVFKIFICFAMPFLQSNTSLNAKKHKASLLDIFRAEKQFLDDQNSRN